MRYRVYEAFTPHRIVHFLFLCFAAGRGLRTALGESLSASTNQNEVESWRNIPNRLIEYALKIALC